MGILSILAAIVAVIIIVLIYRGVSHKWYNEPSSWQSFSATSVTQDWPQWSSTSVNGATDLRFRNCIFTVALGDGSTPTSIDVTGVLIGMALQQQSPQVTSTTITQGTSKYPPSMSLVRALNPFSFSIPGFNDPGTLSQKQETPGGYPWCSKNCINSALAPETPAVVTLTGEFRTL